MEQVTYAIEADLESSHWWFVGRRRLFARLIEELRLPADARVLDVGTGTGSNLRMLRDLGFVRHEGLDASEDAVRWCAEKGYGKVTVGDICRLPYADESFALVLATDILEHVDDDVAALRELRRVLKRDGHALITVPAFRALWGVQDEVGHHKRRYLAREIVARAEQAGLLIRRRFYFNYILFAPIYCVRSVLRLTRTRLQSENRINSPLINRVLSWIFRFDVWSAPHLHPPFGVSYLILAERGQSE